ncbi:hypothetical protein [Pseudooctadecabacter jejudonensis]|uniref:Chromosome partition protein Smc n=1 Tax=Pseudooctadecabacter jejudonensis TaxID=1391910 RepID=A0A1Y5R9E3_9RHOB|nr:hypothetical protein [Pseudooctadecabacter jejudonensis]SLN12191.1 hypothetical protein PSJ8397_00155 [Pseudooctadecabacter jejudonensis]
MSELAQLESRLSEALARIRAGVDKMDAAETSEAPQEVTPDGTAEVAEAEAKVAELTAKLNDEVTANAQLEERVKLLKERQDGKLAELEAAVEAARGRAARMDRELQRLRQVNAELRDNNSQLREAVTQGVSEPHLVNKAMMAELDALRATRAADAAEMDAILEELRPIVEKEASDA